MSNPFVCLDRLTDAIRNCQNVEACLQRFVSISKRELSREIPWDNEDIVAIAGLIGEVVVDLVDDYPIWVGEISKLYFEWLFSEEEEKVSAAMEFFTAPSINDSKIFSEINVESVSNKIITRPVDSSSLVAIGDRLGRSRMFAKEDSQKAELALSQFEIAVIEHQVFKESQKRSKQGKKDLEFLADSFETPNTVEELICLVREIICVYPELVDRAYQACYLLTCIWEIQNKPYTRDLLSSLNDPGA